MIRNQLIRSALHYYIQNHLDKVIESYKNMIDIFDKQNLDHSSLHKALQSIEIIKKEYEELMKEFEYVDSEN